MDIIANEILRILEEYGPMESRVLAAVIDREESEVNLCLYNSLRDYCTQNGMNE